MSSPNHRATRRAASLARDRHSGRHPAGGARCRPGAGGLVMISTEQSRAGRLRARARLLITTLYGADRFASGPSWNGRAADRHLGPRRARVLGFAANDNPPGPISPSGALPRSPRRPAPARGTRDDDLDPHRPNRNPGRPADRRACDPASAASAEDRRVRGRTVAAQLCSQCHVIGREPQEGGFVAPSFGGHRPYAVDDGARPQRLPAKPPSADAEPAAGQGRDGRGHRRHPRPDGSRTRSR